MQKANPSSNPHFEPNKHPKARTTAPATGAVRISNDALSDQPRQSSPAIGFRMAVDR
jgi:hypothetical protein